MIDNGMEVWRIRRTSWIESVRQPRFEPIPPGEPSKERLAALVKVLQTFRCRFDRVDYMADAAQQLSDASGGDTQSKSIKDASLQTLQAIETEINRILAAGVIAHTEGLIDTDLFGPDGLIVVNSLAGTPLTPDSWAFNVGQRAPVATVGLVAKLNDHPLRQLLPADRDCLPLTMKGRVDREPSVFLGFIPAQIVGKGKPRRWIPIQDAIHVTRIFAERQRKLDRKLENERRLAADRSARERRQWVENTEQGRLWQLQERIRELEQQVSGGKQ